jgi:small subunit ribosomal protein S9
MSEPQEYYQGTGRRKGATARVRLFPSGTGTITVNDKAPEDHFGPRLLLQHTIRLPLVLTETQERFDVTVKIRGGGVRGQAEAMRLGIARALIEMDSELRPTLKKAGVLTRDARVKERKKAGLKRARKRPQYTKR